MLNAKHIKKSEYRTRPWKNGMGSTLEIAIDSETPFRWRLSTAMLEGTQPFSPYPGYDRVLLLLSGGPLRIRAAGKNERILPALSPYPFKGESEIEGQINGVGADFNLFCRRERAKGNVYPTFFRANEDLQFPLSGTEHFIFVQNGTIDVFDPNQSVEYKLAPYDCLHFSRDEKKEFLNLKARAANPATVLWVVIHVLPLAASR